MPIHTEKKKLCDISLSIVAAEKKRQYLNDARNNEKKCLVQYTQGPANSIETASWQCAQKTLFSAITGINNGPPSYVHLNISNMVIPLKVEYRKGPHTYPLF